MKKLREHEYMLLQHSHLFKAIDISDIEKLLPCLSAHKKSYEKDDKIVSYGSKIEEVGIILSGGANVVRYDYWGKKHIVAALLPSDLFGESYAAAPNVGMEVDVEAADKTEVLFLNLQNVTGMCKSSCSYHTQLIRNLVTLLAIKNTKLNEKLRHVTQPTLRAKILSYLGSEAMKQHSPYFDIPFDRQELADYLNADRSALSNELSKMKKEGILDYSKNHFKFDISKSPYSE